MTESRNYLAFDLGAESGRAMLGSFDGQRLGLSEIHRFHNGPVRLPDGLHWDVLRLWAEIRDGLLKASRSDRQPVSVGLDTWGVDFALLDRSGSLISNPYHYRDSRTDGVIEAAIDRVSREEIFGQTGVQFMPINTLYQLLSMVVAKSPQLDVAARLLTIPDLFNFWLTGEQACEFSNATTTQCFDPRKRDWAKPMLEALGIPTGIFPSIVAPGTVLGPIQGAVAAEMLIGGIPVVAPACHDTGSAVAAVPAENDRFAWISSGTWSIMGTNVPESIIDAASLANNFTNEGAADGHFRFSKNIMGLWLVQECRRAWAAEGQELTYSELTGLAEQAKPFTSIIDPDHADFFKPGNMPERIRTYCARTGQPDLENPGAIVRCALESLALKYRWVLMRMEEMLGYGLDPIHIVGGGSQNQLLNQFTADATGRNVVAGPVEATAVGNVLVQALAMGDIESFEDARTVVRESFTPEVFEPRRAEAWDEAYARLLDVIRSEHA